MITNMATEVIHEHAAPSSDNAGMGLILGVILVILIVASFMYFVGFGVFRGGNMTPNVSIPDKINVNVNQPK